MIGRRHHLFNYRAYLEEELDDCEEKMCIRDSLSTVKLYAGNVTKTRMEADNIAEKQINYLCILRKKEPAFAAGSYKMQRKDSDDLLLSLIHI